MSDDICMCNGCRRTNWPKELLDCMEWAGHCSCKGADWFCWSNTDNWFLKCPDCGAACSGESAPSIDGTGYGHIVWYCNWLPCGWWWG